MGFGDNASFDAVPAFGGRAEYGSSQGPPGGRREGRRGGGGGGNFSERGENFTERKGYRRQNEDRESDDSQEGPPQRGHFGNAPYSGRGRPQGHQGYEGGTRGQKFGDSRSGFGGARRNDDEYESRPGQDFNRYGNSARGGREDGFGGGRYHGEADRREFSGRDNKRADGGYESRGRLYSDDDPHTRDKRAGFDDDGERNRPPNRRSNEYGRNDRDDSRENWGHEERRANDGRRYQPNEGRGFGNSNRGFNNDADGYRRRDDVGSSRGNFGRDEWEDREAGGNFGGHRRDGPKDSGFAENRGKYQQRSFGDRNDDFDNRGYDRERGNDRGRGFGDRKSGFNREDHDNDGRRPNNRFKEEENRSGGRGEDKFGGRQQNSPDNRDNRKGFGDRGGFGGSGRGGRFGGSDSNRGGHYDKREWSDSGRDDGDRRGGGFGFGNQKKSRFGHDDDNSRERDQQNKREYVSGGSTGERAPKDWTPETTSIDTLFARDAVNAAHFEKDFDESVKIIGADENIEISSWENSGLHPDLIRTCIDKCHYRYVRPIQAAAIPLILSGRDVMGLAETGGGKTAAFVLPILHQILSMGREKLSSLKSGQILALVVAPTRELARQLYDSFRKHAYDTEVKCCVAYGEIPRRKNLSEIHQGCHVLVGTSGRLMDFIQKSDINISKIQFLVLDEADMLLEDGRETHLNSILRDRNFPKPVNRQTLLFSATFPADVERLAGKVLKEKYVIVRSSQRGKANVRVKQQFVQAEGVSGKNDTLYDILEAQRDKTTDDGSPMRTLVFVATKKQADFLAITLREKGILAASINGDRPQHERERVVGELRDGSIHVLVGTDVCQRGLDINGLDHVINYNIPNGSPEEVGVKCCATSKIPSGFTALELRRMSKVLSKEQIRVILLHEFKLGRKAVEAHENIARDKYIHRIGRTGRLHGGLATTFVDPGFDSDLDIIKLMVQVAKETNQEIPKWLDDMTKQDSFTRAGFGAKTSFGTKPFESSSGFGAVGFGAGDSGAGSTGGAFGSGGFGGDDAKTDNGGSKNQNDQSGSATFGEGASADNKKTDEGNESDGSY